MKLKTSLSDEDIALFHAAMQGIKPLKKMDKVELKIPATQKRNPRNTLSIEKTPIVNEFSDHLTETVTAEQVLFFAQPGLPAKLLRELKHGKIKQSAILDLHGYTVERARTAVARMINTCIKRGVRCLRIIHGKGRLQINDQPILKNQINNWLRQHPALLAFCSARPADGGAGAVYVLLKDLPRL